MDLSATTVNLERFELDLESPQRASAFAMACRVGTPKLIDVAGCKIDPMLKRSSAVKLEKKWLTLEKCTTYYASATHEREKLINKRRYGEIYQQIHTLNHPPVSAELEHWHVIESQGGKSSMEPS